MHIQVNGKHIDVGDALRGHVEDRIEAAVGKYSDRPVNATVTFSRDRHIFKCDASVHLATGLTAQAHASADEIYAALDQGVERIEKQLRRYKRRLKDHHNKRQHDPIAAMAAQSYVLENREEDDSADEAGGEALPPIVAETRMDIQSLSVGEAVMQMELASKPFLMFRNDANGRLNVVFHREDGNIGWIDPNES